MKEGKIMPAAAARALLNEKELPKNVYNIFLSMRARRAYQTFLCEN
jgi:hypothetical protein